MPSRRDRVDRTFLSWPLWLTYLVLFAAAIPWYWPDDDATMWMGVPAWVVVAIAASAAISIFTAAVLSRPWPDEGAEEGEGTDT